MHALIVEPQAFTACDIEDALREIGYTSFAFATTTEEAVAAAEAHRPDLVTCAVKLASGCGIHTAETIAADKPVPIVFITHADQAVRRRVPEAPVVRKQPFRVDELSAAIASARPLRIRPAQGCAEAR
jgi:response regulator NasT